MDEKDIEIRRLRRAITKLAAKCHRAKWQFDLGENRPPKDVAIALVGKAFDELHRVGNIAIKMKSPMTSI